MTAQHRAATETVSNCRVGLKHLLGGKRAELKQVDDPLISIVGCPVSGGGIRIEVFSTVRCGKRRSS